MQFIKHLVRYSLVFGAAYFTHFTFATSSPVLELEKPATVTTLAAGIFSPEQGIICDEKAGFCVDGFGISMAFTQSYLGDDAQNKMLKMIEEVGGSDNFDSSRFSFSNKVYCDSAERACFDDRYSETKQIPFTDTLFAEEK
ncbi:YcgJ family protein [Photobacterium sanguinicancri]|uniref:YcgJ family protein n=1 Tax=Photobacterium sanguinicancri TaxID=875932 RepID=A0AAW7Y8L0_9GAMM|nr:YcgJ family protein [Photobacterium sanguinicancri]MDO6544644.1 YcgJ family protein [Photobacterium sanguinicancri]